MAATLLSMEKLKEKLLEVRKARLVNEEALCTMDCETGILAESLRFTWIECHVSFFTLTVDEEGGYIDIDPNKATSIYYYHDEETNEDVFSLCGDNEAVITLHFGVVE